jgi:glycosyltransferase involved in cell wall biosynthesis
MRVLIIPSWYFPHGTNEISGRMFHHYALGLREKDIDARIFYGEFSPKCPFKKEVKFTTEEGVPTWRIRQWFPPKLNSFLVQGWVRKYGKSIMEYIDQEGEPDIIHAQSYMAGLVCAEIRWKTNIPFILTERVSSFISGNVPIQHSQLILDALNAANMITCVSPGLKSYLEYYTDRPIEVIPNFYDPTIFYNDPLVQKNKKFTWISVGEPAQVKGLDLLINAFAKIKQKLTDVDMQLILVDRINEQKELIQLSKQLNVENDITWTGLISQVELAVILRQSHVFVSASRTETFGKAILEAQACGLPVIATKTDGANFIMSSSEQGVLIKLNDVDVLSDAMIDMFSNYEKYNSEKIVNAVRLQFSKDIVVSQWINLFNKLAK